MELENFENIIRAKRSRRIPVVFSRSEVAAILSDMSQTYKLMCSLMYGSGLRVMETLRLRLKNIDQERLVILVRAGKGNKDRVILSGISSPHIYWKMTMIFAQCRTYSGIRMLKPLRFIHTC